MRKLTRSILAATAAVGLLAIPVAGAAADTADSVITFEVTNAGTLSVASSDGTLGTAAFDTSVTNSAAGALPEVTVTDNSNPLDTGWTVTAQSTSFVGQAAAPHTIANTDVRYWSGPVTDVLDSDGLDISSLSLVVVAGQQTTQAEAVAIDTAKDAVVATTATGNHSVSFTPNLIVDLTGVPADTYSGTITHTVSSP